MGPHRFSPGACVLTALAIYPVVLHSQGSQLPLPIGPQPVDMRVLVNPPFKPTVVTYQALPPNNHYTSRMIAAAGGTALRDENGLKWTYDPAAQTVFPLGWAAGTINAYDGTHFTGFRSVPSSVSPNQNLCFVQTFGPGGLSASVSIAPAANISVAGYSSSCTAIDNGVAVGVRSNPLFSCIALNGGDGTTSCTSTGRFSITPFVFPDTQLGSFVPYTSCCIYPTAIRGNDVTGVNSAPPLVANGPAGPPAAVLWHLNDPLVTITLAATPSQALATNGSQQGGWAAGHAALWSGSAASKVDLNPEGYFDSSVNAMGPNLQAGDGWFGGPANSPGAVQHALVWHGSAGTVMDLNALLPPSITGARILGVGPDGSLVGYMYTVPGPGFAEVDQGVYFTPNPGLGLASLTVSSATPAPGDAFTGTIALNAPAPTGGTNVTFATSNAAWISAPVSVTVPEGQTAASFPITVNSAFLPSAIAVTLTADSYLNAVSATMRVTPLPPSAVKQLTYSTGSVQAGYAFQGTVTLDRPALGTPAVVTFNSDAPGLLGPVNIPSVTIPVGSASATFKCVAGGPVNSATTVNVAASLAGSTAGMAVAPLVITPSALVTAIAFDQTTVAPGDTLTGTLTLANTAPAGGQTVAISATNGAFAVTNIVVPAGQSSVPLSILTTPPVYTQDTLVIVTAGTGTVSQTATVTLSPPVKLQFVSLVVGGAQALTAPGGSSASLRVMLTALAKTSVDVTIASTNPALYNLPAVVTIPAGQRSRDVPIGIYNVATTSTGTLSGTGAGATDNEPISVTPGPLVRLQSAVCSTAIVSTGQNATLTVTLSSPAYLGGVTVALASDQPTATPLPASITIPANSATASVTWTAGATVGTLASLTATYNATSASATVSVLPGPVLAITGFTLSPYTLIGPGVVTTATITLNQSAPVGGGGVLLTLSTATAAVKIPASVTVAEGQTSAAFTVQGNSILGPTTSVLTATYQGVLSPGGPATAAATISAAPTDVLKMTKPTWSTSTHSLSFTATGTNPAATIAVLNATGNVPIGTMTSLGGGNFSFQGTISSIASVNIKSNLGGATGSGVTVVP